MADTPDFEFSFGKDKHLKGRGWRGLLALLSLLCALVVLCAIGGPVVWRMSAALLK